MLAGIVVPGVGYTVQGPLLSFTEEALDRREAHVHLVDWDFPDLGRDREKQEQFVRAEVSAALDAVAAEAPDARPVLIAKSIGTLAAPLAAERGLPAVWLTPLLTVDFVVDAIRSNPQPALLVGGTDDTLWLPAVARELGRPFLEIPDGDHWLFVPGPLAESATVLGTVLTEIEAFLDGLAGQAVTGSKW
jgi:hypothetical protein